METHRKLCCMLTIIAGITIATSASAGDTIWEAVHAADLSRVGALLNEDPALASSKDQAGRTPLHVAAAERGDPAQLVGALISYGANVNATDNHGQTPLHMACIAGNGAVASLLIENGASLDALDSTGSTPLEKAVLFRHAGVARLLITQGAQESIFDASALGDTQKIDELLAKNPALVYSKEVEMTPLLWAASRRQKSAILLLLQRTPGPLDIFSAVAAGKVSRVAELVSENPALLKAWGPMGLTPLHWAALAGNDPTAELLLQRGADVNARAQDDGRTPLFVAAAIGDLGMVRLLLAHSADPTTRTTYGITAYAIARADGHPDVAQMIQDSPAK